MKQLASTIGVAVALASMASFGVQAADVPGVSDTEIKVGTFGPLTGPVYIYGKLTMNGVEVYFNKLNEKGGIHGRKLVLVREDDLCKPRSEEHTSELQSHVNLVCRLLLEKKNTAI